MSNAQEKAYWLAISQLPGIGPVRAKRLLLHFGSGAAVWSADGAELGEAAGLRGERLAAILVKRQALEPDAMLRRVETAGAWVLTFVDEDYPRELWQLFDPPVALFGWGSPLRLDPLRLAIVGARRMTNYGKQVIEQLVAGLADQNVTIISGLARGVDGQAHRAALLHQLNTWAVLGSGFGVIYPPEHKLLARQIVEKGGTVLSEYWPDMEPLPSNFPARNRIIAALSRAVLVVEAGDKSGSLITVDHALDLGRDVFAVPGNITSRFSRGTNFLLKQGAGLVTGPADLLAAFNLQTTAVGPLQLPRLSPLERRVWQALEEQPKSFDRLLADTELSASELLATLTSLELLTLVVVESGQNYCRTAGYEAHESC